MRNAINTLTVNATIREAEVNTKLHNPFFREMHEDQTDQKSDGCNQKDGEINGYIEVHASNSFALLISLAKAELVKFS